MAQFEALAPQVAARLSQDLGITPQQAAGIVGALGYESAGLQAINERQPAVPGSRGGFGWAQWTGPRRQQFEAFAKHFGLDVKDPEANYQFLVHELTNTPEGAVLDAIRGTDDPKAAGRVFTEQFLRPGVPAMAKRDSWVERAAAAIFPSAEAAPMTDKLASDPLWQMLNDQPTAGGGREVSERLAADPVWQMLNQSGGTSQSRAEDGALVLGMGGTTPEPEKNPAIAAIEGLGRATKNFVRGAYQGLTDLPAGIGQESVHTGAKILADLGYDRSALASILGSRDAEIARRESEYQAATPGSAAAGVGRLAGSVAPLMVAGPAAAAPIVRGAALGEQLLARSPALGRLLGSMAGGALQGAGFGAVTPVISGDYDTAQRSNISGGAAIGGALPAAGAGLRALGRGISSAVGGDVSPEVGALAQAAKQRGIDIRPDQLINSKPVNAVSATLDYVPFSGKSGALSKQQKQFNTAVSRTIGENTSNVTQAVKDAEKRLGAEFDRVLKSNAVNADQTFQNDLGRILTNARNEMTDQQYGVIARQVDNILDKVKPGDIIDADAAYNIKTGLDRLGKSNDSTLAYYAREMRTSLMDALNRSLPDRGASFAKTRQQWGNLMELQKLASRGAEGDISAAKLANARGIKSADLGELADIAAQFLKGRMGDSGTAQRLQTLAGVSSLVPGATFAPLTTAGTVVGGRLANSMLGSTGLANLIASRAVNRGQVAALQGAAGGPLPFTQITPLQRLLYPSLAYEGTGGLARLGVSKDKPARP
ncbi:phage tail tip lysozyme [Pigmentiphaga daeguensis]|uniref:Phage tail lysozyme domain-containing protein n=1 Tax=Pigmentiphaga daeguensis TaxID=414049 RepID=A0ABN1D393_9BURK